MPFRNYVYIIVAILLIALDTTAQQVVRDSANFKLVVPGPEYKKSRTHQWLWGRNHRAIWTTPVMVPVLQLDSLTPYKTAGGNETKTLRLRTDNDKEYTLRSVRKSRNDVIEPIYRKTFIEDLIKDGISMSHPYAALAVVKMQEAAGIYHPRPKLVYLPKQKALDTFNNKYGNDLYMLEQKASGDWSEARNLGGFKKYNSTEEVIEKLQESNRTVADQYLFIKSRLFDMLICDWDRHDGNWCWGQVDIAGITWFVPVPHDRDQAFYRHNGKLIDRMLPAAGLEFMQNFDHHVGNVKELNVAAKNIDRYFSNAMSRSDWEYAAKTLQQSLTDSVIELSLKQLPPEIYAKTGKECVEILKSRRRQLSELAVKYYEFIAKEVEVTGTKQKEFFDVSSSPKGELVVAVFRANSAGKRDSTPYYQRTFNPRETREVRLFGIDGMDVYNIDHHARNMTVRIIGGPGTDSVIQSGKTIHVYDDGSNEFKTASAQMHLSNDSSIHDWTYKWYKYNDRGLHPLIYYNSEDRLFAGIGYRIKKNGWRRDPFAYTHDLAVNWSISQMAPSITWNALYPKVVGGWDLTMRAGYDFIRWQNFYGVGNETKAITKELDYYRLRSTELFANVGVQKAFGRNMLGFTVQYQRVQSKNDTDRFVAKVIYPENPNVYQTNQYGTLEGRYSFVAVNDSVLPTKGITFLAEAALARNFTVLEWFQKFEAKIQAYWPITKHIGLTTRVGGMHIANDDVLNSGQFYMHAYMGGSRMVRGYRRERFWGQTAFYNSNELRFITDFNTRFMNGKIGLVGFFDQGRVWVPGEKSSKMHYGYGPGLLISPFNRMTGTISYGFSEEFNLIQLRMERLL